MNNTDDINRLEFLRAKAETQLEGLKPTSITNELLHELHAHQIELKTQNEELRQVQITLETSRAHIMLSFMTSPQSGILPLPQKG